MALLDDVKAACRAKSNAFNYELLDLISAAFADIGITDVNPDLLSSAGTDPLIKRAVLTYCKMNFGKVDDGVYDRLKESYDEQKRQLMMSSAYRRAD